ncbi:hypothetical protein SVAN01_06328 [Stagonosporopsis vannaccii]|nr:hypothetical protein SVAN01_06328 [Stagonosporopsis vannaccii]
MHWVRDVVPQCASVWFERVKRRGTPNAARIFGACSRYRNDVETPRIMPRRGDGQDERLDASPLACLPAQAVECECLPCNAAHVLHCLLAARASLYKAARRQKGADAVLISPCPCTKQSIVNSDGNRHRPPQHHRARLHKIYTSPSAPSPFPALRRLLATAPPSHTDARAGVEREHATSYLLHANTMNLASSLIRKKQTKCVL